MKVSNISNYYNDFYSLHNAQKMAKQANKTNDFNKQLLENAIKRADELREAKKDPQHLINLLV